MQYIKIFVIFAVHQNFRYLCNMFKFILKVVGTILCINALLYAYVWIFEDTMPRWCLLITTIGWGILTLMELGYAAYIINNPDKYI